MRWESSSINHLENIVRGRTSKRSVVRWRLLETQREKRGISNEEKSEKINCQDIGNCTMMEVENSDGRNQVDGLDHELGKPKSTEVEMSEG